MSKVFLNDAIVDAHDAKISILDRGFLFGDAIYEVIPVYDGKMLLFKEHLMRLKNALQKVNITNPFSDQKWLELCAKIIELNGPYCPIYIQVSRGIEAERSHVYAADLTPTVLIKSLCAITPGSAAISKGLKAICLYDFRWKRCDIKTTSLISNIMLRNAAHAKHVDECFLVNDAGFVTECASANFFIVKDGVFYTPPLDANILPGVTRSYILQLLARHNIPYQEQNITTAQLKDADEVMISSSTRELAPVVQIDDTIIGDGTPGAMQRLVMQHYMDALTEHSSIT